MADFKPRNILLIGATGNIGRFITQSIVSARGEFDRVAILTSAPAAGSEKEKFINEELRPKKVEIIVGDIGNEQDVLNAYKGIDTVVFALGRGAILPQIPLIKLAASPGSSVKWIFPSEYGTDIKYGPSSAGEPTHQGKLKVRAYIEEDDEIKKSGLKYTYVVTGPYPEMFLKGALGYTSGWDVKSKKAYLLLKDNKISFTTMKDTGDLVLAALRHPGPATFNKALKVNSYTTTPAEIQAEFERQVGGGWVIQEVSIDALKEFEKTAWEDGRPDAAGFTLRRIWAEGGTLYEKRDNDVIGEPETLTLKNTVSWYIKASS